MSYKNWQVVHPVSLTLDLQLQCMTCTNEYKLHVILAVTGLCYSLVRGRRCSQCGVAKVLWKRNEGGLESGSECSAEPLL